MAARFLMHAGFDARRKADRPTGPRRLFDSLILLTLGGKTYGRKAHSQLCWALLLPLVAAFAVPLQAADVDSSALQKDSALVVAASGDVSTEKKGQEWAIGPYERVAVTKPIVTGRDGYARFTVEGGTAFEVFAQTRAMFRENPGNPRDLLDVETGHVRLQIELSADQALPVRVLTPVAIVTSRGPAWFAIAVDDEDNSTRIDVQRGEVTVRHALIPGRDPVIVKAGDAISVEADEPLISRRLDRGSLYHLSFHTILRTLESVVPGRSNWAASTSAQPLPAIRSRFCNGL